VAILWQQTRAGTHYEVRSAGRSLRLYSNGVFHTQYNPTQPLTGHVWDLLMLPAFFHSTQNIKRILVLGVGGGAVIHLFRHFLPHAQIVGIELDKQHIRIARRFFRLKHPQIKLHQADAITWIKTYKGEKFDLIIDDLFMEKDGEPVPVVKPNVTWFSVLLKHLNKNGILVKNYIDRDSLKTSAGIAHQKTQAKFPSIFQLTSHYNENFVVAFSKQAASSQQLRQNLRQTKGLNPDLKSCRLRYRIRRLK